MPDTARSQTDLKALAPDNTSGSITAQTFRDAIVSAWNVVDHPDLDQQTTTPAGSSGQMQFNSAGSFGGAAAVTYSTSTANLTVTATGAAIKPLVLKGAGSQTASLLDCQTSTGSSVLTIGANGTLTVAAPSGMAVKVPAPSGTSGRYITLSSSHNAANGGDDEATFISHNYDAQQATNRGRIDSSRAATMLGIESGYKVSVGAVSQDEYYFQTVTPSNAVYRSLMSELRYDGTSTSYLGGNWSFVPLIDNDQGVSTVHWQYETSSGRLYSYGQQLLNRSNNTAFIQQRASDGTSVVNLIYLTSADVTAIGGAAGVSFSGPVQTTWSLLNSSGLTLANNVPLRSYNSSGASPVNLIVRNADGSITLGASGATLTNASYSTFSYTPANNGDAPLNVTATMTGNSTNFYGLKVGVTWSGANNGSVHYLSQLAGNCTSTSNSPTVTGQRVALTANGTGAYIPDATGFEYSGGTSAGYIAAQTGYKVKTPTATSGGFHSATFYGFYAEDITGPTNPYAIYTGAGWHRFGSSSARVGFFGSTPVVKPTALTAATGGTINSGDATTDTEIANMRTRIGELETKLQALGLLA